MGAMNENSSKHRAPLGTDSRQDIADRAVPRSGNEVRLPMRGRGRDGRFLKGFSGNPGGVPAIDYGCMRVFYGVVPPASVTDCWGASAWALYADADRVCAELDD